MTIKNDDIEIGHLERWTVAISLSHEAGLGYVVVVMIRWGTASVLVWLPHVLASPVLEWLCDSNSGVIRNTRSGIRNGFEITSSIPASRYFSTCSRRAFARKS